MSRPPTKIGSGTLANVAEMQRLLNLRATALGIGPLRTDGVLDADTRRALGSYAARLIGAHAPGKVGPGDAVAKALADTSPSTLMRESVRGRDAQGRMSGADWAERAAAFANSRDPGDLAPLFAVRTGRFLYALSRAGAQVYVDATRRDAVRAWLIRNARAVAGGTAMAGDVTPEPRAPVIWDHGDHARSRAAAAEMAKALGPDQSPPEGAPHFDGHVISMTVRWAGPIEVIDAHDAVHHLDQPHDGALHHGLHTIGESYGVGKAAHPSDWSFIR